MYAWNVSTGRGASPGNGCDADMRGYTRLAQQTVHVKGVDGDKSSRRCRREWVLRARTGREEFTSASVIPAADLTIGFPSTSRGWETKQNESESVWDGSSW